MTTTCIGTQLMSLEQWQSTPDHPIQRNTKEHADRSRHLQNFHPTQAFVTAVKFGDIIYKVDGHTRAFLWAAGKLKPPEVLNVQMWGCTEYSEVEKLYRTFDARTAADTSRDDAWGIMRKYGLEYQSEYLRDRKFLTAIRQASAMCWATWRGHPLRYSDKEVRLQADIAAQYFKGDNALDNAFQMWIPELNLLDDVNPFYKDFPVGVTVAAMITLGADPLSSKQFWHSYSDHMGSKHSGEADGTEALHHYINDARKASKLGTMGSHGAYVDLCQRAINCCRHYMKGQTFKVSSRGGIPVQRIGDVTPFVRRLIKRKTEIGNPQISAMTSPKI